MKDTEARPDTSVIVGRHPVREALERDAGRIEKVLIQKGTGGPPVEAIRRLATQSGVPVQYVPAPRIARLAAGLNHQGVAALASPVAYVDLDAMLRRIAPDHEAVRARKPLLLLLDQIEDPYNLGAILRSAAAAGVDGVIVTRQHMAPVNAAALKASAGTAGRVPVARVGNLAETILQLKERGYWVAGAAGDGETTVWEMDWDRPVALVMGSEGKGLRRRVADVCDYRVAIPMRGAVESLNVSVATGILLFEAVRVRLTASG
ncbi:23S rRNA (guanosine(2251)-2'-O)-methyltransferase RlmB [Rhodothermaceae bacterium RA]|nr:23S rRNA (guanosine(2251)-2'-O)-methyltransferase RlmB [Rhodothermaceae bacterium RA]